MKSYKELVEEVTPDNDQEHRVVSIKTDIILSKSDAAAIKKTNVIGFPINKGTKFNGKTVDIIKVLMDLGLSELEIETKYPKLK